MAESPREFSFSVVRSKRLKLIASTVDLINRDVKGGGRLTDALAVHIPDEWPPDLYGPRAMQYALQQLGDPAEQGWSFWYLVTEEEPCGLIGICGFKGRPDEVGSVEIGYSILTSYQEQGFATEAVARLVAWAFSHYNVQEVCAETLPHLDKSIRVLEKNGFTLTGAGSETGVIRYSLKRSSLD